MSELPEGSCIVPDVVEEHGLLGVEEIGTRTSTMRMWKVETVSGGIFAVRNFLEGSLCTVSSVEYVVSKMGLGKYGPPEYVYRGRYKRRGMVVCVEARRYVQGATLRELIGTSLSDTVDSVMEEINDVLKSHSRVKFDTYGISNVCNDLACSFMEYMGNDMLEHTGAEIASRKTRYSSAATRILPKYRSRAVLCHNNINPDHVIVHGGSIVAIVGWSLCDITHPATQAVEYRIKDEEHMFVMDMVYAVLRNTVDLTDPWVNFISESYLSATRKTVN